jgi:hypothetical protein
MGARGAKPEIDSPKALKKAVDNYFARCAESGVFPDYAGMCLDMGKTKKEMQALGDSGEEYQNVLDYAKDKRESYLARLMASDNKRAMGCMNNLKQPINGGYVDRPVENSTPEIKINVVGVGGEEAFK